MMRKHLGSPACWGKQHHLAFEQTHHAYQGAYQRGFARTGISAQYARGISTRGCNKMRQQRGGTLLCGGERERKFLRYELIYFVVKSHGRSMYEVDKVIS